MSEIIELKLPREITTKTLLRESNKSILAAQQFFAEVMNNESAPLKERLSAAKSIVDAHMKITGQLVKEESLELNKRLTTVRIRQINQELDKDTSKGYENAATAMQSLDLDVHESDAAKFS